MLNYKPGETIDVEAEFGVEVLGPNEFRSKKPLAKPAEISRGAYGGNIAGQAILVAIRSSPEGFFPHSLHSYFVKPVDANKLVDWEVEEISKGKNFCNRSVKGKQDGEIKYFANISLTKNNSHDEIVDKPFEFQTPLPPWVDSHKLSDIPVSDRGASILVYYKLFPELHDLSLTKAEEKLPISERRLSYYTKWGIENEGGFNQPLKGVTKEYQYVGLAILSDALFLTRLARTLRAENHDLAEIIHYYSVSLDHAIFFHDTDFDTTKWMTFAFKAIRYVNHRVILEAEMYNDKGVHVATIVQEGIVHFNGLEEHAKL
ncbi:HotDog domain-containing protein [Scheffersomyces xylosifermentans]|uniref:HotDog domain-containing protein n=1 Tax=Scheffersomyces xylosifermentans TaxID=1304137 RepID=UPI00315CB7D2